MRTELEMKERLCEAKQALEKAEAACEVYVQCLKKYEGAMNSMDRESAHKYGDEVRIKMWTIDEFFAGRQEVVVTTYRNVLLGAVKALEWSLDEQG